MKLDQLPVEILLKIFSYLPTYGEVSLVNKLFYNIACKVNDSNICLWIDWQFFGRFLSNKDTSSQWMQSIQTSNRQISKIRIVGEEGKLFRIEDVRLIIPVIEKFSSTNKFLKLAYITTDESNYLEILSLTPNIEHLNLCGLDLSTEGHSSTGQRCNYDLTNLKKLKSLTTFLCSRDFVRVLNRLPVGVLTELMMTFYHWNTLVAVLDRQFTINKLKLWYIQGDTGATEIFDKLNVESLELHADNLCSATIAAILSKQNKLKSLTLCGVTNEQVMKAVADLMELEKLTMYVVRIPDASVTHIGKFKKLQEFDLQCYDIESTALRTLAEADNASLKMLSLSCRTSMSVDLIAALAKSAPNLKRFEVSQQSLSMNSTELDAIMRHFNYVEVLSIEISNEPISEAGDYFNPKLRELQIFDMGNYDPYFKVLTRIIASYPNLKKLKLTAPFSKISLQIRPILNGFPKLESLVIRGTQPAIEQDLDYLCEHKGNLKFLSWRYNEANALTDESVKKLRAIFSLVCIDRDRTVDVAVDRYTMNCERNVNHRY